MVRSLVPVIMAGMVGIYGLLISVYLITAKGWSKSSFNNLSLHHFKLIILNIFFQYQLNQLDSQTMQQL